ncbi:MAG: hypothetical protein HZA89_06385 [Verrucomicrobia bacterium]|nr:hypothetical protein [Verrucomicrobiota bacterium]
MSDPLRIAMVVEGPTDSIVISAAITSLLNGRTFIPTQLHPETSAAFGEMGTGWGGVCRWSRQAAEQGGGSLRNNPLFEFHDLLILHLDAEVADENYANAGIDEHHADLPCSCACPPASNTTNALRQIVLRWIGEVTAPPKTVICIPSKCIETWILVGLYPHDATAKSADLECVLCPVARLQAKPAPGRLIRGGKKDVERYRERATEIASVWPGIRARCAEAERFSTEFLAQV